MALKKIRLFMSTLLRFVPFCYLKTKPVEVRTIRLLSKGAGVGWWDGQTVGWIEAWMKARPTGWWSVERILVEGH